MEESRFSNTSAFFERDQGWSESDTAAGRSFFYTGRAVTPEVVNYLYPSGNIMTSGLNCASQHTWGSRMNHPSTNRLEGPGHLSASYDTLPQFAIEGSFPLEPEVNTTSASNQFNGQVVHEGNAGIAGHVTGRGRGRFKRKIPTFIPPCETVGTTGFYEAGSSSLPNGLPPLDCSPFPSNSFRGGGSLTIGGEDAGSNARNRYVVDSEPIPRISYFQSYIPGPNGSNSHLPNPHRGPSNNRLNNNAATYGQNHISISPPAHVGFQISANNTLGHEMNPYYAVGNAADASRYHDPILRRNPISPPHYFQDLHALSANEDQTNYYQRPVPSQRTDVHPLHSGQGSAISGTVQPIVSESYPSRFARPFLSRGWHYNHREGRSRISLDRLQSHTNAVDAQDRLGGEDLMMFDGSYLYGSRNMSDQYGDMRLDIDNMSYEELLALGDSIGNVNTGLSGNVVSECLLEKKHSISDKNVQVSCAICLEEYKKTSRKGKLKKCGHEYHIGCIKKWLSMKNSCPICKGPAAVLSDQE
ncbi:Probable E3 ubiquitin-protein ligase RHG1A [Linum perenne]